MRESSPQGLTPRRPTSPAAAYVGGKRQLAGEIIKRIAKIPHQTYAEPFVGMGGVFLRRPFAARCEVINDYNRDVATFFRVLQRHYAAFMDMMKFQITTRAEFERLAATPAGTLTDMERAARFLYLQKTTFGGKVKGRTFGVSVSESASFNITRLGPLLEELHDRLAGVTIECLPYAEFIRRYDRPETLFYLDPPYWGTEDYYGAGMFSKADFEQLAAILAGIHGQFLLSINDVPQVRAIFKAFKQRPFKLTYSVGKNQAKPTGELLISV